MAHEFDGKKYEQASTGLQVAWGEKLIARLDVQGSESVLDLGCGAGTLAARIAELVPKGEVLGIDASQGMIDAALPKAGANLSFRRMDIDDIDFVERFDIAFSNATLHWVLDHRRLYRNVLRALRPGGRIHFNFAGDGNCSNLFRIVRDAMALERFAPHFAGFQWPWYMPTLDEYKTLVASAGLRDTRLWGENADKYFPDQESMIQWIDQPSIVPVLAQVPENDKPAFRQYIIRRMLDETKQPDGNYFETFRRINVAAVK